MEENNEVVPVEETAVEEVASQNTPEVDPRVAELEAHNKQLFERAKKAEADAKAAKVLAENAQNAKTQTLDVEDYINISASLEGLDQREKEYLAEQHKLSGKPLPELRKDENFELWQSAYRAKVEKEKLSLKPTGTQSESEAPKSFNQRLAEASVAEKEKLLTEAGLYKSPRPRADRVDLGRGK